MDKSTRALRVTFIISASAGVLKWLKLLVLGVVVCILLALSKFSLVPWETDLAFYGRNTKKVNTMILRVVLTLSLKEEGCSQPLK